METKTIPNKIYTDKTIEALSPTETVKVKELIARKLKHKLITHYNFDIPEDQRINDLWLEVYVEDAFNRIKVDVTSWGYHSDEVRRTVKDYTPSSKWQKFKEDKMPKWFVNRFPVKQIPIVYEEHFHVCPHIKTQDNTEHIRFLFMEGEKYGLASNSKEEYVQVNPVESFGVSYEEEKHEN